MSLWRHALDVDRPRLGLGTASAHDDPVTLVPSDLRHPILRGLGSLVGDLGRARFTRTLAVHSDDDDADAVTIETITLTAAIYAITIGTSSNNLGLFGISIVLSVLFASIHGIEFALEESLKPELSHWGSLICIFFIFFTNAIERFIRHVIYKETFVDFKALSGQRRRR